jgi:hypothetical protein
MLSTLFCCLRSRAKKLISVVGWLVRVRLGRGTQDDQRSQEYDEGGQSNFLSTIFFFYKSLQNLYSKTEKAAADKLPS